VKSADDPKYAACREGKHRPVESMIGVVNVDEVEVVARCDVCDITLQAFIRPDDWEAYSDGTADCEKCQEFIMWCECEK